MTQSHGATVKRPSDLQTTRQRELQCDKPGTIVGSLRHSLGQHKRRHALSCDSLLQIRVRNM